MASLDALELAKRPFTITRTVGQLAVQSDQVAVTEWPFGALGALVLSAKAEAAGAAGTPDPVTEAASDSWFLYKSWAQPGSAILGQPQLIVDFDSKAQRKVADGEDVAFVVANVSAVHAANVLLSFRMLVKLS